MTEQKVELIIESKLSIEYITPTEKKNETKT